MSLITKKEQGEVIENNPVITEEIVNELYNKINTNWNPLDSNLNQHKESLVTILCLSILFMDKIMYNLRPSNKKQNGGIDEFVKNTDELIKFTNQIEELLYISINFVVAGNNKLLNGGSNNKKKLRGGMNLGFTVKDIILIMTMLLICYKLAYIVPGVQEGIKLQIKDIKGIFDAKLTGKTVYYDEQFRDSLLQSEKILVKTIIKPNNGNFYNMYEYVVGADIDYNEFIDQYIDVCKKWNNVVESGGIPSTSIKAIQDGNISKQKVENMNLSEKTALFEHLFKNTIEQNPNLQKLLTKDLFFNDEFGGCSRSGELSPKCIVSGFPKSFAEAQSQLLLPQSNSYFPSPSTIYNIFTRSSSDPSCNINHLVKATYNGKNTADELENLIDKLVYKPDFYIKLSTTDGSDRDWGDEENPKSMKETIEHLNKLICDYDKKLEIEGEESNASKTALLKIKDFWIGIRKKGIAKLYHPNNSQVVRGIQSQAGRNEQKRSRLQSEHDSAYADLNIFLDLIEKESNILPLTRSTGGKRKKTRKFKKSKKIKKTKSKKTKNKKTKKQTKRYKRKIKKITKKRK